MKNILLLLVPVFMLFVPGHTCAQDSRAIVVVIDPYLSMYDYASMPDTVIRQVGNVVTRGFMVNDGFEMPDNPHPLCCFATRTIRVKSGRLREVVVADAGTGMIITRKYKKGRLVRESRRFDIKTVRNAPPYH